MGLAISVMEDVGPVSFAGFLFPPALYLRALTWLSPPRLCVSALPLDSSLVLPAPMLPPLLPAPDPSHRLPLGRLRHL